MTADYMTAIDEIYSLFNEAWKVESLVVLGYIPAIQWPNVEKAGKPDQTKFWVRISNQTLSEEQSTLSNSNGIRRYTNNGLVLVEIFCPKSVVKSNEFGKSLASISKNIFRGASTASGVFFRKSYIKELPQEDSCYRFMTVSEYEYDDVN